LNFIGLSATLLLLSTVATCPVGPGVAGEPLRGLQVAAPRVAPTRGVAPAPPAVVGPPAGPVGVPVLVTEGQRVVALAPPTAAMVGTPVVVATVVVITRVSPIVVSPIVIATIVVATIVIATIVIATIVISTIAITTAPTVVVAAATKNIEESGAASVLPVHLPFLPSTGAGASTRQEEPLLPPILGLSPLPLATARAEATVPTQGITHCRREHRSPKSSQPQAEHSSVQSSVATEETGVGVARAGAGAELGLC